MLPWLWCRLAAAAPIRPLAWEPPYAAGVPLKRQKKKKKRKKKKKERNWILTLSNTQKLILGALKNQMPTVDHLEKKFDIVTKKFLNCKK